MFNFLFGTSSKKQAQAGQNGTRQKRRSVVLDSLEDAMDLRSILNYELRNRRVGAFLLQRNETYQFVFGFTLDGYHPTLGQTEFDTLFNKLENGLKDFPNQESMTVHYEDFRSLGRREHELNKLWDQADNEEIQMILASQLQRDKELVSQGKRREKRITLYCTYTVSELQADAIYDNWVEKSMSAMFSVYEKLAGEQRGASERFERIVLTAFIEGYLRWENFLSSTLGWDIEALRHEQLWRRLWERFNRGSESIPVPQVIHVRGRNIEEEVKSSMHPVTLLTQREPVADDMWVNVGGRYVAPLTLVEKPGGWANRVKQLRYLWDTISSKERLYDVEIFAQITRANESLVQESVRRLLAQSITSSNLAMDSGTIDVAAQLKTEKAVDAQKEILEGSVPFWLGFTILAHRRNIEDLDETCKYIESCFLRPCWIERERFIAWKIWLQTLPITMEGLLTKPTNRRHLFLHNEVIGLLPLVKPQRMDEEGLELVTDEGGYPVFVDLFRDPKHVMILAMTRAGKSVLITYFFIITLARRMGVTIIDYPRLDGTSTFTDLTLLTGGAYIDIMKESLNCMEIPDVSHLPEKVQNIFMEEIKNMFSTLFFLAVMGSRAENHTSVIGTQVRSIIGIATDNYFKDEGIKERYRLGRENPDLTPTGHDFYEFLKPKNLQLEQAGGDFSEAFALIELRLRQFFSSPVGKAIVNKSTVRRNNRLTVYAFTNVSNEDDAAILAVVALSQALQNSLQYPHSIFFIDEAPILFEFEVISNLIGRLCANGGKAGISVIVSAQDPDTIAKSPSGSKIIQAMSCVLVGRIKEEAIKSFVHHMSMDESIIMRNASKAFLPKKSEIYSQWLLSYGGYKTYCRFYPGLLQLAMVMNNPSEQRMRDEVLKSSTDKYDGYRRLINALLKKLRG